MKLTPKGVEFSFLETTLVCKLSAGNSQRLLIKLAPKAAVFSFLDTAVVCKLSADPGPLPSSANYRILGKVGNCLQATHSGFSWN